MAIALVQSASTLAADAISVSVTLNGVTAGNTLVIVVACNSGAPTLESVADSVGNPVSTAVSLAAAVSHGSLGIYYVNTASAGTHQITVTWSAAEYTDIFVAEYSGVGVLDTASAVSFGASTTVSTSSITPSQSGDLIIFGLEQQSSGYTYSSYTNGFSQQGVANGPPSAAWAAMVQGSAAAISGGTTSNGTAGWAAAIAAFKAATPPPQLSLSPSTLPGGTVGVTYSETITASGGTAPYSFAVTTGTLPPGLSLSTAGVLSGMPTTVGSYSFTIEATGAGGYTGSQPYSGVTISVPNLTLSPATVALPDGTVGSAYSQQFIASGGISPYTYSVNPGALPPGLTLSSSGLLSGKPMQGDYFIFAITATDSAGHAGTQFYGVTIEPVSRYWNWQPTPNES